MNQKQIDITLFLAGSAVIVGAAVVIHRKTRNEERAKRKAVLTEVGLDVAAIHNATDVINSRIERGEIRSWEDLREAVTTEVAFQKMVIREEDKP